MATASNPYETTQPGDCPLTADPLPLTTFGNQPHNITKTGKDERFVAGSGGCFDQYRNRNEVVGNRLRFYIDIDRYYSTDINTENVDPQGFLFPAVRNSLIADRILPEEVLLEIESYDVDYLGSSSPNSKGCKEVDYIFVNGR